VNIGSPSGITDGGGPDIAAYVMSKHAIEGLTDSLVLQLGPLGVQVSAVEPGAYRSDMDKNMLSRLTEDEKANMLKVWGPTPDPMMFPEPTRSPPRLNKRYQSPIRNAGIWPFRAMPRTA
jgi:NAD(P)-dependent dehydrogenase (short-subunit alcohol dehydrogenase family)